MVSAPLMARSLMRSCVVAALPVSLPGAGSFSAVDEMTELEDKFWLAVFVGSAEGEPTTVSTCVEPLVSTGMTLLQVRVGVTYVQPAGESVTLKPVGMVATSFRVVALDGPLFFTVMA